MITLLTDFGASDYFVPAVKGSILSINPQALVVDITHEIPAQDMRSAAFTLGACYADFPAETINLAIVDPGVGSDRRAIIVKAGGRFFVGPDNGIFSYVFLRESEVQVFEITKQEYFRRPVSPTFHGRDVFAPVAAWLSRGVAPESIGEEISDYVRFEIPAPHRNESNQDSTGAIIHIDRFGNCVTNFTGEDYPSGSPRIIIGGVEISRIGTHYAQAAGSGDLFAYTGSAGYLEIGLWRDSAAKRLDAKIGDRVVITL